MKNKGNGVKTKVNVLAESAEEIGKIVTDNMLSGSKLVRTSVLGTSAEEKDTPEGVVKDTLNVMVETAESISGVVADSLLQGSKKIRNRILDINESSENEK